MAQQKTKFEEMQEAAKFATQEFMCGKCKEPIKAGESHSVWLNFGEKPDEHFHGHCLVEAKSAPKPRIMDGTADTPMQFPLIIGRGISSCMRDRTNHLQVQREMDDWFNRLPADKDERIAAVDEARKQIESAKLALDAFYSRFRQCAVTAKS